jgi:2,3-bisphosphoglycerate-dependent phosphoglycerate mutase
MVARGDLGNEVPLEEIPSVQREIIQKSKAAGKPVITATGMLLSMTESPIPARAEVSDVTDATLQGSDAVMLSEETASGKYPVESVTIMEKIILQAEQDGQQSGLLHPLVQKTEKDVKAKMGALVLVRHHESEWNKKGLWTGSRDVNLTPYGFEKSKELGLKVHDILFDHAFASMQVRSIETLACMLDADCEYSVPTEHVPALNERDYGDYTGKNKWDMEKMLGEEEFDKIRRDWNCPVPHGETLKMVYKRAVPFYVEKILPLLRQGKNVLVVSHGNTIRALMKYIENISDEKISSTEMIFGSILIYTLDTDGHMLDKEIRSVESVVHA